ncbi:MAG: Hsp20/alpha crystallin family protein [Verrucomicrobiales bacterium]|nr:Hsp20/alpha crystallin family protein [Verrucomicrobiales bacterium]
MSENSNVKTEEKRAVARAVPERGRVRYLQPYHKAKKLDDADAYEVAVVLPGVNKKGLEVSVEDGELTVIGGRADALPEGWRPVSGSVDEQSCSDYRLLLTLNVDIDSERISAKLEDGILTLRLPVSEASKPRRVAVE